MIKVKSKLTEFKSLIKVIGNVNNEASLTFQKDSIYVRVVDVTSATIIVTIIKNPMFEEYNIKNEVTYSINISMLHQVIDRLGRDLIMELEGQGLKLSNEKGDEYLVKYFVGKKDDRPLPNPKHTSRWRVSPSILFDNVGASVEFSQVGIFTGGENLSLGIKSILTEGHTYINAQKIESDDCISHYDMGYFIYISSIRNIFDEIEFCFGKDTPCSVTASNDLVDFKWYLAPRVRDEEDED